MTSRISACRARRAAASLGSVTSCTTPSTSESANGTIRASKLWRPSARGDWYATVCVVPSARHPAIADFDALGQRGGQFPDRLPDDLRLQQGARHRSTEHFAKPPIAVEPDDLVGNGREQGAHASFVGLPCLGGFHAIRDVARVHDHQLLAIFIDDPGRHHLHPAQDAVPSAVADLDRVARHVRRGPRGRLERRPDGGPGRLIGHQDERRTPHLAGRPAEHALHVGRHVSHGEPRVEDGHDVRAVRNEPFETSLRVACPLRAPQAGVLVQHDRLPQHDQAGHDDRADGEPAVRIAEFEGAVEHQHGHRDHQCHVREVLEQQTGAAIGELHLAGDPTVSAAGLDPRGHRDRKPAQGGQAVDEPAAAV